MKKSRYIDSQILSIPKRGSSCFVDPIRNKRDIQAIIRLLEDQPRNQLLFILGINTGIRVTDLLPLRVPEINFIGRQNFRA